jgi:hypothetical protein
MSTYFSRGTLSSEVINAIACLHGMPETCHCLHEHVLSWKLTTNLKPLPPNVVTSATSSQHSSTSKFNSLLFSFGFLIIWGIVESNLLTSYFSPLVPFNHKHLP